MVIAPRGRGDADEHALDEEGRGRLLQPQPRVTDRPRDHVAEHVTVKPLMHTPHRIISRPPADPATPLQVAVPLEDERSACAKSVTLATRRRAALYFTARTSPRILTALGPRSLASWSWMGLRGLHEAGLVDVVTIFTPIFSSCAPNPSPS